MKSKRAYRMMNVELFRSFSLCALTSLVVMATAKAQVQPSPKSEVKEAVLDGAKMKTNADLQNALLQADHFAQQERYDLASVLWQKVIDESDGQVFTRDEWKGVTLLNSYQKYRLVRDDAESILAALPPEGLEAYRRKADGEALALMTAAGSKNREAALARVVSRFFLSRLGDEAAFELACLMLDRQEFLSAADLLMKIVNEYPDPTVSLGEINVRLAAVHARVGDANLAQEMIGILKDQDIPPLPVATFNLLEKDIEEQLARRTSSVNKKSAWTMAQGNPTRTGLMPALAEELSVGLTQGWSQGYALTFPDSPEWAAIRVGEKEIARKEAQRDTELLAEQNGFPRVSHRRSLGSLKARTGFDKEIIEFWNLKGWQPLGRANLLRTRLSRDEASIGRWKSNSWRPVGQVLMSEGLVYFKTNERIACCDASSGELQWFGFRSKYPKSPISAALRFKQTSERELAGDWEEMSFSDSLNQSMSIIQDKLAVIQGTPIDFGIEDETVSAEDVKLKNMRRFFGDGAAAISQGRARENRLFVYNAKSGRLLWMLRASKLMQDSVDTIAFAGSAVPYGSLMIIPVYEATSLWIFGLNADTGEVLWKSFIADEPEGQTARNSPVRVAVDGADAYVATGAGLIASIDAIGGSLNWALTYPRTILGEVEANVPHDGRVKVREFDGWDEDIIMSSGNRLVVAPSDFNFMVALDRQTGKVVWDAARTPAKGQHASEYVLGISEGVVCVAGKQVVRGYALESGRLLWEKIFDERSYGRGMLTMTGIYIPTEKSIMNFSTLDGKVLAEISVGPIQNSGLLGSLYKDSPPLGSLFTDGEHVFDVGLRQVRALKLHEVVGDVGTVNNEEVVNEEIISEHKKLADELLNILTELYGQLALVTDNDSAWDVGQAFVDGNSELVEIAERMQVLGAPNEETRQAIEEMFLRFQIKIPAQMNKAIAGVLRVNQKVGTEVLQQMIRLHRKAEEFPILNEYGIELSLGVRE